MYQRRIIISFFFFCFLSLYWLSSRLSNVPKQKTITRQIIKSTHLTFATVPRSFALPSIGEHQLAAISSWALQKGGQYNEILFVSDIPDVIDMGTTFGWSVHGNTSHDHSVPLLDSVFGLIDTFARHNLICFINSDIGLPPNFYEKLLPLLQLVLAQEKPFLIAGPRLEFFLGTVWYPSKQSWRRFYRDHIEQPYYHTPIGDQAIDWFVFQKGSFAQDMPPFRIGRYAWDSWMLQYAIQHNWLTIGTEFPELYGMHWEHTRYHHDKKNKEINLRLAEQHGGYAMGRLQKLGHVYKGGQLLKK